MPAHNNHTFLPQLMLQYFWTVVTVAVGLRRVTRIIKQMFPGGYQNTIFYFDQNDKRHNTTQGFVALSIDDGLSRGGVTTSLVPAVLEMLQKYDAKATFFVCTDYVTKAQTQDLVVNGHELANHLKEDVSGYYATLSKEQFKDEVQRANKILDDIERGGVGSVGDDCSSSHENDKGDRRRHRWFRAPQGVMTRAMRDVIDAEENMTSVLGDCYCDDWYFAENAAGVPSHVAPLMLQQVHPTGGSIAVLHMPETGFREANLQVLEQFLIGIKNKNMKCITLSQMSDLAGMPTSTMNRKTKAV